MYGIYLHGFYCAKSSHMACACRKKQDDHRQGQHRENFAEEMCTPKENFLFVVTDNVVPIEQGYNGSLGT